MENSVQNIYSVIFFVNTTELYPARVRHDLGQCFLLMRPFLVDIIFGSKMKYRGYNSALHFSSEVSSKSSECKRRLDPWLFCAVRDLSSTMSVNTSCSLSSGVLHESHPDLKPGESVII